MGKQNNYCFPGEKLEEANCEWWACTRPALTALMPPLEKSIPQSTSLSWFWLTFLPCPTLQIMVEVLQMTILLWS